jgi:soluble lytic murein transglycosylase-like protein
MAMKYWFLFLCLLLNGPVWADGTTRVGAPGEVVADTQAASDDEQGDVIAGNVADIEPAAGKHVARAPKDETQQKPWHILNAHDVRAYKAAFAVAKMGKMPSSKDVGNKVLWGEVQRIALLNKKDASFAELNGWMKDHRDMAGAADIYEKAQLKRERPREVCRTKKVPTKVKVKVGKGKHAHTVTKTKMVSQKSCKTVGKWGPEPVMPLAMEMRDAARDARDAAREQELSQLSDTGRKILGQSWRARMKGDYAAAMDVLLRPGARVEAGSANWQAELVRVASYYHGKRDWKNVVKAAEPAAHVSGPNRDDARWLAGYGYYQMKQPDDALEQWQKLVEEQPELSPHYGRAAWWGARAARELGKDSVEHNLLQKGAKDRVSFYGQLCAAKMGRPLALDWTVPGLSADDLALMQKEEGVTRALALLQLGDVVMAQKELKLANPNLPTELTRPLAVLGIQAGLPALALSQSKSLLEKDELLAAGLFPVPDMWRPEGGWKFDKAMVWGIMRQESAFQPQIGSRVGAQGLMQLMPATANYVAGKTGKGRMNRGDLHDPTTNLTLAQDYLTYLSSQLDGNMLLVVAAYNGGIGNVRRWLDRGVTPGHDPVMWLESIPYDETRDYVEKVFANYWLYQQRLGVAPWSLQALADGYWPLKWAQRETARHALHG